MLFFIAPLGCINLGRHSTECSTEEVQGRTLDVDNVERVNQLVHCNNVIFYRPIVMHQSGPTFTEYSTEEVQGRTLDVDNVETLSL